MQYGVRIMRLGYAWTQQAGGREDEEALAIERAGCDRIVVESSPVTVTQNPLLNAMLARLEGNDMLVVWRLERLAKSTSALIELFERLSSRGIGLHSVSENFSLGGEDAAVSKLLEVLADFDRSKRREQLASLADDHKIGRPRSLAREDIERARALVQEGKRSVVGVAIELGVSRSTLYRYLKEEV